jgi:hypothetical protein
MGMMTVNELAPQNVWWDLPDNSTEAALAVHGLMRQWDQTNAGIQAANLRNLRLYSNRETQALSIAQYILAGNQDSAFGGMPSSGVFASRPNRITLNVVKSCVDTVVNKLSKNKIIPKFLTTGGALSQRTKAEQANQFIFGLLNQMDAHQVFRLALRDAAIFGTGFVKACMRGKKAVLERVFPDEIMVDPSDAYYGDPLTIYQRKFINKRVLQALYPDRKAAIEELTTIDISTGNNVQDTVLVIEAWRMSRCGIKGRHIIAADGVNLFDEPWKRPDCPIRMLHYCRPVLSFWGTGIAEELIGIQVEINRLLMHIQECMRLLQQPRIFVENGSKANPAHWVNDIGTFIPYSGNKPPVIYTAQTVHPEIFQQLENLYRKAFEIIGVSQLAAQSKKPAGLDSGRALREFSDIESERMMLLGQDFEDFVVDCSNALLSIIPGSYTVVAFDKNTGLKSLTWSDIEMRRDDYMLKTFPVSALPQHPAARLEYVTEMAKAGDLDPEDRLELLNLPDLESKMSKKLAPTRLIERAIESALDKGEYVIPEPYMGLDKAIIMAQQYFSWAILENYPDDRVDMVRRFIDECAQMKDQAQPMPSPVSPAAQLQQMQLAAPVEQQLSPEQVLAPGI